MNHSTPRPLRTWRRLPRRTARPGVLTRNAVLHSPRARRALARSTRFVLMPFAACGLLATGITALRADTSAPAAQPEVKVATPEPSKTTTADVTHATLTETSKPSASDHSDVTLADAKASSPKPVMRATRLSRFRLMRQDPTTPQPPGTNQPPTKPAEGQPAQNPPAPVAAATGPAPGTVTISGLVDLYFEVNARAPHAAAPAAGGTLGPYGTAASGITTPDGQNISIDNIGRSFDINDRDLTLSLGEINITRTAGRGFPLGVTATLTVGDTARLVHATEPGGTSAWQNVQQAYLTYPTRLFNRDLALDFGIFVTPFGYEVIESPANDNYSRGFVFQFAIPLYHAGLRAGYTLTPKLSLAAGVVNGWNNIADDNDGKSAFIQATWKPDAKFTGIFGFMGGPEGTGTYGTGVPTGDGNIDTNIFEFEPIFQATPKLKLAGDIVYGQGAGDVRGIHLSDDWLGLAAYARYQFTNPIAAALRIEQFEDMPGVGGVGLRTGGAYQKLRSFTLTGEYATLRSHLIGRLEYRHDIAENPFFGEGDGAPVKDQDTFTVSAAYKF